MELVFHFWEFLLRRVMIIIGRNIVTKYFAKRAGHEGMKVARSRFDAWLKIAESATWNTPEDVKKSHPKASILKGGRAVFNIKGNDFRLVVLIHYQTGVLSIRFIGTHPEYDQVDAEKV
jgi:mRNA interferase HigB